MVADNRGVYQKFTVTRTDGSDEFGGKHYGCNYFVLDLAHDKHARAALLAYAASCAKERPELARDLRKLARAPIKQTRRYRPDRNMMMRNMMGQR